VGAPEAVPEAGRQPGDRARDQALGDASIGVWQLATETGEFSCDPVTAGLLLSRPSAIRTVGDLLEQVHPDDRANVSLRLQLAGGPGPVSRFAFRLIGPDGAVCWLELTGRRARDPGGGTLCVGTLRDVTMARLAEEALAISQARLAAVLGGDDLAPGLVGMDPKRSREMLAMFLDGAGAGTWEIDFTRAGCLTLSPNACRIYGLSDDHCGTLSHDEWAELLDPESLARMDEEFAAFMDSEDPRSAEFKIRCADDEERWLRIHGRAVLDDEGKPLKLVGLVFDDSSRKRAEEVLRQSEEHLRVTQEAVQIGTFVTDIDGTTVGSAQFYRNLGLPADTTVLDRHTRIALLHPVDRARVMEEVDELVSSQGDFHESEHRIYRADTGEERWMLVRMRPVYDKDGKLLRMAGVHLDITQAKNAEYRLKEYVSLNQGIVESSPDCIKILDLDGTLRFMSARGLETMEADDAAGVLGTRWQDLWPEEARASVEAAIAAARAGEVGRFDAGCVTLKGNPMWVDVVVTPLKDDEGNVTQILSITRDVTELRAQAERVRWIAEHDALTSLPNRNYFEDSLADLLFAATVSGEKIGLLALDVDNFKQVNDAYGHDAGDTLLKALSERVGRMLGDTDFAARLGGDEFAIVVRHLGDGRDLLELGKRFKAIMKEPIWHRGCLLDCRVSIGAAIFPEHGADREELLKSADTALYAAKTAGRNHTLLYEKSLRSELDRRTTMLGMAGSALERNDIAPYYQPQVCLKTGQVAGFEALLRWQDPTGAVRAPAEIEAAFQDRELAHEISERMQDCILRDVKGWLAAGIGIGHVAINAAAAEFSRNDFAQRLLAKLDAAGVDPHYLQVEVTETVFLGGGAENVGDALLTLKGRGVGIALDDFGTGFASLAHLKKFPVDVIKIDRSFIAGLGRDSGDTAIVRALLGLAADMGIKIVAEGIETETQAYFLKSRHCDFGQGYFFGRAVEASQVPSIIEASRLVQGPPGQVAGFWRITA